MKNSCYFFEKSCVYEIILPSFHKKVTVIVMKTSFQKLQTRITYHLKKKHLTLSPLVSTEIKNIAVFGVRFFRPILRGTAIKCSNDEFAAF